MYARHKVARPTVFIPVFPGTNCEYDSAKAFERAGADVITKVFKNLTAEDIRESVDEFRESYQIRHRSSCSRVDSPQVMSRMVLQNSLQQHSSNAKIKEAVMKLLNERDGLALGICNGFQALIKLRTGS